MQHITRNMLQVAIDAQQDIFDSHDIERHLYQHEQRALVHELHHNVDAGTYPFTETCRQIGLELSRMTDVIEKMGESSTPTFSGHATPCAKWSKVRPRP
jgi:hypothetical protein